jgi:protein-tyrosine phosphatase
MTPLENWTEIVPGLFMGGSLSLVQPCGFDAIVCCREVSDWKLAGPPYLHLPMEDIPVVPPEWYGAAGAAFIAGAMGPSRRVLVHCAEGHNRSGFIVASYLIRCGGFWPQEAINLIRKKRPGALTNQVFVAALLGNA